ncbi:MAG TPA: carbonic anhydrase [Mycobacteriales bacterium]|nr:carbonic anhydrase [Mycobacteriales bacterium]
MSSAADELIGFNARYADKYTGPRPVIPSRHLTVVTCMDSRMDVHALLGLELGEAHVIRNAGGIVTDDVIRSLTISQRRLKTEAIIVIHHDECGLLNLDEDAFVEELVADGATRPSWRPGTFSDVDASVAASVASLRASSYLKETGDIRGFVFDISTGLLREVT